MHLNDNTLEVRELSFIFITHFKIFLIQFCFTFSVSKVSPKLERGITHGAFEKCLRKSHLSLLSDDYDESSPADYTLCAAYKKYGLPIDWNLEQTTTDKYTTDFGRLFWFETTSATTTTKKSNEARKLFEIGSFYYSFLRDYSYKM